MMKVFACILGALLLAGVVVAVLAFRDIRIRERELDAERRTIETRFGIVEYSAWGDGPPVLVIHGAGGGFDQGRLLAEAMGGESFFWIAPSRFGYLGGALPEDASTSAQADAFAELLNHREIDRVAILAMSGGAPPALKFAEQYPDRTLGLALLSPAPFTPFGPEVETRPIPGWAYQALLGNDVIYWLLTKTGRGAIGTAFDARSELLGQASEDERKFVDRLIDGFLPALKRVSGVQNEIAAVDPSAVYDLQSIRAPVLVVHARDDRINAFEVGETIAERVPDADFISVDKGGHLLLGHHSHIRLKVVAFLRGVSKENRE